MIGCSEHPDTRTPMPTRPEQYRPHPKRPPQSQVNRPTAHQRGYGSRWQKASKCYLRSHPLCAECERNGRVTEATCVDHITPHRGDMTLFWDVAGNWQSLCKPCHDAKTAKGE